MDDPRAEILKYIDIHSCRVEFSAPPIVLLFGGKVKEKERSSDPEPPVLSFRHAIALSESKTSYELFRPEEITSWQADGVFKNLMDFETDLASICTLVVIVLESAGSIAELGAFSQLPDLSKKLIVIRSNAFTEEQSFINHGILRYILELRKSSVKTYPWDIDNPSAISSEVVSDFFSDINDELSTLPKSAVFKLDVRAHAVVFVCELIRLFVALKEIEIFNYIDSVKIKITKLELRRIMFLLEKFQLIKRKEYSDSIFFLSGRYDYHRLSLSFNDKFHVDGLRIPIKCVEYYNDFEKVNHRSRVIKTLNVGDV